MKYSLYILAALIFLFACEKKKQPTSKQPIKIEHAIEPITKVNPAVLMGATGNSFLVVFATHWKLGHFSELMKMTDQQSIKKYGVEALEIKYKEINLAMQLTLKSMVDNGDSTYLLNYETNVMATQRIIRVKVRVLEDDSVKLIVEDLEGLFQ